MVRPRWGRLPDHVVAALRLGEVPAVVPRRGGDTADLVVAGVTLARLVRRGMDGERRLRWCYVSPYFAWWTTGEVRRTVVLWETPEEAAADAEADIQQLLWNRWH